MRILALYKLDSPYIQINSLDLKWSLKCKPKLLEMR